MVFAAPKNRKAVAYTKIGVLTETDDEKQWLGVAVDACMAVEVVTVVEVRSEVPTWRMVSAI